LREQEASAGAIKDYEDLMTMAGAALLSLCISAKKAGLFH